MTYLLESNIVRIYYLNKRQKELVYDTSSFFIVFNGVNRQVGFREYYLFSIN